MFEVMGGEPVLRDVIDAFVDRTFDDMMIGFFFARASRDRVKEFEYQHAAAFLGAEVVYEGKSLQGAHGAHHIRGGHFARRKEILRQVMVAKGVPGHITQALLDYTESLRAHVTTDVGSECAG